MSNRLLLVRRCAIFISLVHFLIFVSLCLPVQFPIQNPGEHLCIGWQEFFPCDPLPSDIQNFYLPHIMDYVIIALIALVVLVLPPLAAQAIFRPRWRIIGLPALWISLPLMLGPSLLASSWLCMCLSSEPMNRPASQTTNRSIWRLVSMREPTGLSATLLEEA